MAVTSRLGSLRGWLGPRVARRVRIDARSLAAFRVALGLLLLADLALRSRNLTAFYTDAGVLPRATLFEFSHPLHYSLHALSGEAWFVALVFAVQAVFALELLVGYRSRVAVVASWLLLVSLHNRNPVVLNGGDFLLRLLLFWGMFLPLGRRWSVDARRRDAGRSRVVGVATFALLAQVVLMYAVTGALKLGGDLWLSGQAIEYVLSLGQFTHLFGDALAGLDAVEPLLAALTYLWLAMVVGSPLLVVLTGRWRTALVGVFAGMHLGMALVLRIDLFAFVSVAALLPFLPGWFWDRIEGRFDRLTSARRWILDAADAWLPALPAPGLPARLKPWPRRGVAAVAIVFLGLIVLFNLQVLGFEGVVPDAGETAVQATRTDQYWNMFAPDPMTVDGWVVAAGDLANGSRVDAFRGGDLRWDRPPDVSATYPTPRWRKYLVNLWDGWGAYRTDFADYLCRHWDATRGSDLASVDVYFVKQPTRVDAVEPTERVHLVHHDCDDVPA